MTTLLALDTATEACSAALLHQGRTIHRFEVIPRMHAVRLLPMIDELLDEAGLSLAQVDALVFGRGPGAFTGVRIATGMVQGLAFATGKPVIAVSNLAARTGWQYAERMGLKVARSWPQMLPDARDLLSLALPRWQAGDVLDAADAQPVYLRDKVATPRSVG